MGLSNIHLRARHVLLFGLLSFGTWQILIGLVLECGPINLCDPDGGTKLRLLQQCLADHPARSVVLALGSSRTMCGLQAERLNGFDSTSAVVFNYGVPGAGPVRQLQFLRRILSAGIQPKFVFIEVVPAFLGRYDTRCLEETYLHGMYFRAPELSLLGRYSARPWQHRGQWCLSRFLPIWYRPVFQTQLLARLGWREAADKVHTPSCDRFGWQALPAETSAAVRQSMSEIARSEYEETLRQFVLAEHSVRALDDLLASCRQRGIRAALLLMPEASEFRLLYSPDAESAVNSIVRELSVKWDAPVVDARTWNRDEDFWDMHHLMPPGAAAFTEQFRRELARLSSNVEEANERLSLRGPNRH
jgi:hypothetical protein